MNQLQADQTKPESCPSWGGCAAPLCPHDPESLEWGSWYPDEGICQSRKLAAEHRKWVRKQRKIAQVSKNRDRYFTYADLTRLRRVTPAVGDTQGHNPDVATSGKAVSGGVSDARRPNRASGGRMAAGPRSVAVVRDISLVS